MKNLNIFLLIFFSQTLFIATYNVQPFSQIVWLISSDEDNSPRSYYFGLKNLYPQEDTDYFNVHYIEQRDPYFQVALLRDQNGGSVVYPYMEDGHSDEVFNRQHRQYFLNPDLSSYNGYYYVLEDDPYNAVTGQVDLDYNTFCEQRFFVTYYNNYRAARRAYEFKVLYNPGTPPLLVFGGPNGILDSTKIDYFLQRYLSAWCPYLFGMWSREMMSDNGDTLNFKQRYHVYLGFSDGSNVYSRDDHSNYIPTTHNIATDATAECQFTEEKSEVLFIPSEMNLNCDVWYNSNPGGIDLNKNAILEEGSDEYIERTYTICAPKYWDMIPQYSLLANKPRYYSYMQTCQKNNRTFIQLNSLYQDNITVTIDIICKNNLLGNLVKTGIVNYFNNFYNLGAQILYNNPVTTINSNVQSNNCNYRNLTEYNNCVTNLTFRCTITKLVPSYLDYKNLTPITSLPSFNSNASIASPKTIRDTNLKLTVDLNLYTPAA